MGPLTLAAPTKPCEGFQDVPAQGPSCPVPGGWLVLLADGTTLLTHGPDPKAPSIEAAAAGLSDPASYPPSAPACSPTTAQHVLFIFARPVDVADHYEAYLPQLRDLVNRSNGHLRREAAISGDDMSYRFACDPNGLVHVERVNSSVASASTGFSAIVNDLQSRGYTSDLAKYLVFWDDFSSSAGGQGNVNADDRLVASNANNFGPNYAIDYGYLGGWGMLTLTHELTHNMGGVQLSAPHTSGGWHCNDGVDTMCYADGGSKSVYTETSCTDREWFDCGHDDYYDPSPPLGSYLATHWNIASRYDKYLSFGPRPPDVTTAACGPNPALRDENVTCTFAAVDVENVTLQVDWGDGSSERLPASGSVAPGVEIVARHAWTGGGEMMISIVATDESPQHLASAPFTLHESVGCVYRASSRILLGTAGLEFRRGLDYDEGGDVPVDCPGHAWTLKGTNLLPQAPPPQLHVCWNLTGGDVSCSASGAPWGLIPAAAIAARITLDQGVDVLYELVVPPGAKP